MTWFLRFILGLSPRIEDVKQIKEDFPELFFSDDTEKPLRLMLDLHIRIHGHQNIFIDGDIETIIQQLKRWIKIAQDLDKSDDHLQKPDSRLNGCVGGRCLFSNETNKDKSNESEEPQILEVMTIGGGLKRKAPMDAFVGLLKKVHSNEDKPPHSIFITDPFLYVAINEKNDNKKPFENLKKYFSTIGITENTSFNLYTTSDGDFKSFQKIMNDCFKKATLNHLSNIGYTFHDRFYIASYKKGHKGVYGPSISGLSKKDVVLMGEIEPQTLTFLTRILNKK